MRRPGVPHLTLPSPPPGAARELRANGGLPARGRADAEHVAKRAEDALRGRRRGEQLGDARFGEQVFQLRGAAGGLVAEHADQPAAAGGEHRAARNRQRANGARGGAAGRGERPGGTAGHQAPEAAGDEGRERRDDEADPPGEVGGEGGERDREKRGCHGKCS